METNFKVWDAGGQLLFDAGQSVAQISEEYTQTGELYRPDTAGVYYFEPTNNSAFQFLDLRQGKVGTFGFFRRPTSKVATRTVREIRLPENITAVGNYGFNTFKPDGTISFRATNKTVHVNDWEYQSGNGLMGSIVDDSNWVCVLNGKAGHGTYNSSTLTTPWHMPFVEKVGTNLEFRTEEFSRSGFLSPQDAEILIITAS